MVKMRLMLLVVVITWIQADLFAAPIPPAIRALIPANVEQILSLDYRTIKQSPTALSLKAQVMPTDLRKFDEALISIGINPDKDLENLTFASFRNNKHELKMMAVAMGSFSSGPVLKKMSKKIQPIKYRDAEIYPMSKEFSMAFTDNSTLLFGDPEALLTSLYMRSNPISAVDSNQQMIEVMQSIEKAPVWSELNHQGTQEMLLTALGKNDQNKLAGFAKIKKQILDSHYIMSFDQGIDFSLELLTADSATSAALVSQLTQGILFKTVTANPLAKTAFQNLKVRSDQSKLQIRFQADRAPVQKLLQAQFFTVVALPPANQTEQQSTSNTVTR